MDQKKISLISFTKSEMQSMLKTEFNQPKFRAEQIINWLKKGAEITEMRNLPTELKEKLDEKYRASSLYFERKVTEAKSNTDKYLFRTKDDIIIESVVLSYEHGDTICVSSQAGCKMACTFCASGACGFFRDLTYDEMLSQVFEAVRDRKRLISNIVLMGSGEPLDNYEQVKRFIQTVRTDDSFGIGIRHITLSTCGIIPGIEAMIQDELFVNLSVSMHAPISSIRAEMMPIEKVYPIKQVVQVCNKYREQSGRRVTYEYCVVEGKNDSIQCADALVQMLKGTDAHVNLIDVNEGGTDYAKNRDRALSDFAQLLKKRNLNITIRRTLGSSINAACGQLRSQYIAGME